MAEKIAPDYDRYFFSLRSNNCLPGFAAFDGKKLANHRKMNDSIDQYNDVLEDDLLFFIPKFRLPRIVGRMETFWLAYEANKPMIASNLHQQLGSIDLAVRNATIHRNAWGVILNADVVIERETGNPDQVRIRKSCKRIIKKSLKEAKATLSVFSVSRYLPLGFARVRVFQRDYRTHRLSNFSLAKDLVCTVQVQRIRRIKSPDILGSTIEIIGRYRIAWNRRWLEHL